MTPETWLCPDGQGRETREYALAFDQQRAYRILIIPALLDEGTRLRRLTVEVMRRLNGAGHDCFLPDLPGTNESLTDLAAQSLDSWTAAMLAAANHFRANRVLAVRGGCLVTPRIIAGWHYAPVRGSSLLRQMLRARILADREAGNEETQESLLAAGEAQGLDLGGYHLGAEMLRQLRERVPDARPGITPVSQDLLGEAGLWLRAEADESPSQADGLAAAIAMSLVA